MWSVDNDLSDWTVESVILTRQTLASPPGVDCVRLPCCCCCLFVFLVFCVRRSLTVAQADLRLPSVLLPQPQSPGIIGRSHHACSKVVFKKVKGREANTMPFLCALCVRGSNEAESLKVWAAESDPAIAVRLRGSPTKFLGLNDRICRF